MLVLDVWGWGLVVSILTKAARDQDCTIQLHPHCLISKEPATGKTTVFCHAPSSRKGWGIKTPDFWGAFGCHACHDIVDGRRQVDDISKDEIYRCFMRGVFETMSIQIDSGAMAKWLKSQ